MKTAKTTLTRLLRLSLLTVTAFVLFGCGQARLGTVVDADVEVFKLPDRANPFFVTKTSNLQDVEDYVGDKFDILPDSTKLDYSGMIDFSATTFSDSALYLVVVSGGKDIDANDDGKIDGRATTVRGEIRAIMTGTQMASRKFRITALTEAAYQDSVEILDSDFDKSAILSVLDASAGALLDADLNEDGTIDYDDVLVWHPVNDRGVLVPSIALLSDLLDDLHNGADTMESAMSLLYGAPSFTVGGSVSGLSGFVDLTLNGTEKLTVKNGSFTFASVMHKNADYSVAIVSTPSNDQECLITNESGTVQVNINNVSITCSSKEQSPDPTFTIGGQVSGLEGSVNLRLNGSETISVSNGSFTFNANLDKGAGYQVLLASSPQDDQICSVNNGNGTANADVSNIAVSCKVDDGTGTGTGGGNGPGYFISGRLNGLTGGFLEISLMYANDINDFGSLGTDLFSLSFDQNYRFQAKPPEGGVYMVTISRQPEGLKCTLSGPSLDIGLQKDVENLNINCVRTQFFTVGGNISGLNGSVTLSATTFGGVPSTSNYSQSGGFLIPASFESGDVVSVTVTGQPSGQTCVLNAGASLIPVTSNISSVQVTCSDNEVFSASKRYRLTNWFVGDGKSLAYFDSPVLSATANVASQSWKVTPLGNGVYKLNEDSVGDIRFMEAHSAVDSGIIMNSPSNSANQQWRITKIDDTYFSIVNVGNGQAVDSSQTNPLLAAPGNFTGQFWKFTEL